MSNKHFAKMWGRRDRATPENGYANPDKLRRMKEAYESKSHAVDHNTAAAIQAAFDYSTNLTRSEYRPLAHRNFRAIQRFGVRAVRLLVVLIIVLLFLGWKTLNATTEIQDGRRKAVIDRCHSGQRFLVKLKANIDRLPEPERAVMRREQERPTVELAETIIGRIDPGDIDCSGALAKAGL